MPARSDARLPCPGVRFEPGFARRVEALAARLALARERREGGGVPSRLGGGAEFVGYRPYSPGDDLRSLDWDLWARSRRPWVRVARREAGERWLIVLDASASMGVGPPGKLQRAAEVAAGIAALALKTGAEARVAAPAALTGPREIAIARRSSLVDLLTFLESLRAEGASSAWPGRRAMAHVSRVFLIGDLRDRTPEEALGLRSPGRELCLIQLLAPIEIAPPGEGAVEWWDPERGARFALEIDARSRAAYEVELAAELERWRSLCARRGVPYGCFSSALGFEEILQRSVV